jgi:hypothetical protein
VPLEFFFAPLVPGNGTGALLDAAEPLSQPGTNPPQHLAYQLPDPPAASLTDTWVIPPARLS